MWRVAPHGHLAAPGRSHRLEHTLTTGLSPLVHERCDDWRIAVEASVAELLDGDHVVFGLPVPASRWTSTR